MDGVSSGVYYLFNQQSFGALELKIDYVPLACTVLPNTGVRPGQLKKMVL